ncbi:hypothetical protein CIHG_05493 [Coccidioides immitis H538.4]|uniref:Uncharacterized protein n=2 Tax=Coccidioides immitis TaxID=5501 RepID=A0A0J8R8X1_COCIT|nr:hypothetical protein CISG_08314 [Coccidioides immitis RMSCC 3703]KMU87726.1 hypothetical protein CIHG_05493 [Coccidioides immitis H538.4]
MPQVCCDSCLRLLLMYLYLTSTSRNPVADKSPKNDASAYSGPSSVSLIVDQQSYSWRSPPSPGQTRGSSTVCTTPARQLWRRDWVSVLGPGATEDDISEQAEDPAEENTLSGKAPPGL